MTRCHFGQLINHLNSKRFNKKLKKQNIINLKYTTYRLSLTIHHVSHDIVIRMPLCQHKTTE